MEPLTTRKSRTHESYTFFCTAGIQFEPYFLCVRGSQSSPPTQLDFINVYMTLGFFAQCSSAYTCLY